MYAFKYTPTLPLLVFSSTEYILISFSKKCFKRTYLRMANTIYKINASNVTSSFTTIQINWFFFIFGMIYIVAWENDTKRVPLC